ncbi:MAG: hypothetical protein EOO23_08590, partial [Comamonadaceae bacterium]
MRRKEPHMTSHERLKYNHASLPDARFTNVDLSKSAFQDVSLRGASF